MPALPMHTDVLIVGAGPAGLALAASLAQLGVDHALIDRNAEAQTGSRAAGVQPHTLEYLVRLDVAERLIADGIRGQGLRLHDGEKTLLRLPYEGLDTPYPFLLCVPQQVTEKRLAQRLSELGGTIHRGHQLITFRVNFPGVMAAVSAPDGTLRAVHARYLAGCDGVHSRVRAEAGISFPGDAPEQLFAIADVRFRDPSNDVTEKEPTFFFSPKGLLLTVPLPGGLERVAASVPADTPPPSAADVEALLATRGPGGGGSRPRVAEVVSASTYHVQQRVASKLSDGPVFLVGDAAHTHSPAGGQGMNTGIQDAANLAWKLHEVLAATAPGELLDSYHRERHPVAAAVVALTSQVTTLATMADPATCRVRNDVLAAAGGTRSATDFLATRLAQLDIDYETDTAVQAGPSPYKVGRRISPSLVAPAGLSWTLAVPTQSDTVADGAATSVPPTRGARLAVRVVNELDTSLLIRPDGYLAASGVPADPHAVLANLANYALGGAG